MQFTRLRLRGFKSFVDPTDMRIEPGTTGVVGPNGCGKSNLVEALRWVMGETSAKRMRGGEMDDVIFGGTARRPAHNVAEVALHLDNGDRTAPAQFNDLDELDIVRRIEREKGSNYKVNGKEVRARDVQLLFADQATGAHATALVSQGRIGAIVNAKPSERRHLLEEAAGIGGLHARRHEAELRLRAAESNLERLDDVISTLEEQLKGLEKQVKQAQRYRRLSDRIKRTEAMLLHLEGDAAKRAVREARDRLNAAETRVAELTETAAARASEQADAHNALAPLREAEATAAAEVQRLTLARQSLNQEARQVAETRKQADERLNQIDRDRERAAAQARDAATAIHRLQDEAGALRDAQAGEAEAIKAAERGRDEAQAAADAAESALHSRNERVAADEARANALDKRLRDLRARRDKLDRQLADATQQRTQLEADTARENGQLVETRQESEAAEAVLATARDDADSARTALGEAREREAETRDALQEADAACGRLQAELDALAGVLATGQEGAAAPVLDAIRVRPGMETALGAALGDDLHVPPDPEAPAHWRDLGKLADAPPLPEGIATLADAVSAPAALARRLGQIGAVPDATTGDRLQARLAPGQRLVTADGDVWRWDGYTAAADAPTAAAQRLAQQNRLDALRTEMPPLEDAAAAARERYDAARAAVAEALEVEKAARQGVTEAQNRAEAARKTQARLEKQTAAAQSRLQSLRETETRLAAERAEVAESVAQAEGEAAELPDLVQAKAALADARAAVAERRQALAAQQSGLDNLHRESRTRADRIASIDTEIRAWEARAQAAQQHLDDLDSRRATARSEIDGLADKPAEIESKKAALGESLRAAEARRAEAADALAVGESRLSEADKALKTAESELSAARETRVRAEAAVEQAETALNGVVERVHDRFECALERVLEAAGAEPGEDLPHKEDVEAQLHKLTRERDNMGPVNLRAEAEAEEMRQRIEGMQSEREDLVAAIARLRQGISNLNKEGRQRLVAAFEQVNANFADLFTRLFGGGSAHLALTESEDPLMAGLEIMASPPGKKLQVLSLLSGGEQALTALGLLFAVFLTNPAPICVLDEVDAPLDDANVDRFCHLVGELARNGDTRFLVITHHRMTMSRMDRLFGVTMSERGVSQLVSVDLNQAESLRDSA